MNTAVVVRTRVLLAVRSLAPRPGSGRGAWARTLIAIGAAALIPAILGIGFASAFDMMRIEGAGPREAALALGLAFNAALVVLLVSDLHAAVAMLVSDPDLELLRRAPLRPRQVLFMKLADAMPQTLAGLLLVAAPATIAYHAIFPLPLWTWGILAILMVSMWAIPLALGTAGALWVLGRVPGGRAREALGVITALMLFFVWLGSAMMSLGRRTDLALFDNLRDALAQVPAFYRHGPAGWAAAALGEAAEGRIGPALTQTLWLTLAAGGALALAVWTAGRRLDAVQSRLRGAGPGRRAAGGRARRPTDGAAMPALPVASAGGRIREIPRRQVVRALALRDARLFLRDWPVLSDVVIAAVLWSLLPVLWSSMFGDHALTLARAMFLALAVGLGNEIAGRAVPIERRGLAWSKLAPLPPPLWIAGKLTVALGASAGVLTTSAVITIPALSLPWGAGVAALLSALPALVLSNVLGLWSGAVFGRSDWTHPRGMMSQAGRLIGTAVMIAQVAVWWAWAAALGLHRQPEFTAFVWGLPVAAILGSTFVLRAIAARVRSGLPA